MTPFGWVPMRLYTIQRAPLRTHGSESCSTMHNSGFDLCVGFWRLTPNRVHRASVQRLILRGRYFCQEQGLVYSFGTRRWLACRVQIPLSLVITEYVRQ